MNKERKQISAACLFEGKWLTLSDAYGKSGKDRDASMHWRENGFLLTKNEQQLCQNGQLERRGERLKGRGTGKDT